MNGATSADDGGATAAADLVLLHQNLAKSKRVTTRMTALLTSFDDRLARLDKSVVPIHRSTKDLSKIQRNVESALLAIDAVLGTNDLLDREEEVLMRDPREDLATYQASLTRLKSAMESMERSSSVGQANGLEGSASLTNGKGKEREGTLGRVRSLIDLGCNNLGTLFFEYTESASPKSGWTDISQWDAGQGVPVPTLMPQSIVRSLVGLLGFLRTILGQDSPLEKELQKGYGDRRGMFVATTLNQVGREVVDAVEVQTSRAGFSSRLQAAGMRGFGRFLDTMFALVKV
jgi:exocyst complex protein 7